MIRPIGANTDPVRHLRRKWGLDRTRDQWVGHDYPGVVGSGFGDFVLDEVELGARAAISIGDPEQTWWVIYAKQIQADQEGVT